MHGIAKTEISSADTFDIRRSILRMLHRGNASHVGPCMSMVEILSALFNNIDLVTVREQARDRDRIFVSKGHSAAALYAVMHHVGLLSDEQIQTYHRDDSLLAGHVSHYVDHVEHSTGALGHGLSVACGCALGVRALRRKSATTRLPLIATVVGDGEIQEGSVWESLMFASHHQLPLVVIVDNNRISSITRTSDVMDLNPLAARFEGFGLNVTELDGHDLVALTEAVAGYRQTIEETSQDDDFRATPHVFIANTTKGRGVPFAEHEPVWHYRPLSDQALADALSALAAEEAGRLP